MKRKQQKTVQELNIKVGDMFSATWGYDQTNVDYFQVRALVGKHSVKLVQVAPIILDVRNHNELARTSTIKVTRDKLAPLPYQTHFIKDNINGDTKRVQSVTYNGKDQIYIGLTSYASASAIDMSKEYIDDYTSDYH